jgi:imidazolonepropionase-like amidohydrolase
MRKYFDLVLLLTICFTTTLSCVKDTQHIELLIKDITILDVDLGTTLDSKDIAITKGKIQAIGEDLRGSNKTVILDGSSLFALPGLWDMHVHTAAKEIFFPLYLANGVTGVRDMGGDHQYGTGNVSISLDSLTTWRNAIQRGEILGPRLIITGPLIDGPDPVYPGLTTPINTEQEAREMVRSIVNRGADFTKVYSNLTPELYKALADESKRQGIPFAGHVPKSVSVYQASELGQKSMEHLTQIIEEYDDSITDDLLLTLQRNQSWQTPTLIVFRDYKRGDGLEFMDDPRLNYIPEYIRQRWAKSPWWHEPRTDSAKIHQLMTWNRRLETVKRMHTAGVAGRFRCSQSLYISRI